MLIYVNKNLNWPIQLIWVGLINLIDLFDGPIIQISTDYVFDGEEMAHMKRMTLLIQ